MSRQPFLVPFGEGSRDEAEFNIHVGEEQSEVKAPAAHEGPHHASDGPLCCIQALVATSCRGGAIPNRGKYVLLNHLANGTAKPAS